MSFISDQVSDEKNELKIYRKSMENLWMKDFIVLVLSLYVYVCLDGLLWIIEGFVAIRDSFNIEIFSGR